jgi:hypothetical protein
MNVGETESVALLFERAVDEASGDDDEGVWDLLYRIVKQRDRAFELSVWRMRSGNVLERTLAVYILGLLTLDQSEGEPDIVARLLDAAKKEREPLVRQAIVIALRQVSDPRAVPQLIAFARDGEGDFKRHVIQTLGGCIERSGEPTGIDVIIAATRDKDQHLRDWATFELGLVISRDTTKIRDALFARVEDENEDCRREAIAGLARRRDQRVIPILQELLTSDDVWRLDVQAAGYLRSKRLLPALQGLREWWDLDPELLETSIDLCDIKVEARNFALYEKFRGQLQWQMEPMFPGVQVSLACDLTQESGPIIAVANNVGVDISYPTVPVILARELNDPETAAEKFYEDVIRDTRFGRRNGIRK